mgnify:CR=1 FL=1
MKRYQTALATSEVGTHSARYAAYFRLATFSLILAGTFVVFGVGKASADDWLSGYAFRKKIPVNATSAETQTDYQMSIAVHSGTGTDSAGVVYLNDNLVDTTNFDDIRFATTDGTLKNYWIQSVTDETGGKMATVYVKIDTPASGTIDYYIYYGKSGDNSASSYDDTFSKDFEEEGLIGLWHMDEGAPGDETLINGNFESWTGSNLDNWTFDQTSAGVRDITKEISRVYAGSNAAKLTATEAGGTGFGLYQDVTTTNGETYQLTIHQQLSSRTAGVLKVEAYDNSNSISLASQSISATASSYSAVNVRFTSTNTTSVRIKLYLNSETTSGIAYVDSISLRQSSNSLTDVSGNNNTGTIYGAARTDTDGGRWGSIDQQFLSGSSLSFDGRDDYVSAGNLGDLDPSGPFTLEAWIYPSLTNIDGAVITKHTGSSNYSDGFQMRQTTPGSNIGFSIFQADRTLRSVTKTITVGQWNHVVAVYDGSHINIYVNGVGSTPVSVTGFSPAHSQNLTIGKYSYASGIYFDGQIDDARIYSRALSSAEINRQYIRSKYASIAPLWSLPASEEQYAMAVTSNSATLIADEMATLNGYLSGLGGNSSANVYFRWGTDSGNLTHTTASQEVSSTGAYAQTISGLSANTAYYFQAVAEGAATIAGDVLSFKTALGAGFDYYYAFVNSDGTLTFKDKNTGSTIVDSSPRYFTNYGSTTTENIPLTNFSFETGAAGARPTGWTVTPIDNGNTTIDNSTDRASEGSQSLKFDLVHADTPHRNALSPLVAVNQDKMYTISVDSYMSQFWSGDVEAHVYYYTTADGTGTGYSSIDRVNIPKDTGDWHTSTFTWKPPADAKSFKILLFASNVAHDTTVYFDNIMISEVTNVYASNGNDITSNVSVSGDSVTVLSTDDSNPTTTILHRHELDRHSPYVRYSPTLIYKQDVRTAEERFDFTVPTQNAQIMTRDLELNSFDVAKTYYSDQYTPKIVKFDNGLSFLGDDTMESMQLRSSGSTESQLSFYSDYQYNHPYQHYTDYPGGGSMTDVSATVRSSGDTYSVSIVFGINPDSNPSSLAKTRQPYGYEATAIFTNHTDAESLATINAVAYGSEDPSELDYGSKGIVGRGLGWTKSVFVFDQANADLQDTAFKALSDKLYQDGVEIVGHTITPDADSREIVDSGMQTLSQYEARNWIDHGSEANPEGLHGQGTVKDSPYYTLDLFDDHGYQYAWSYNDFAVTDYNINMLQPGSVGTQTPFFYYNNNVDDDPSDSKQIYLWSTINTSKTPERYYTNAHIDNLISDRGFHVGHEYLGHASCQNHSWYVNGDTGKTEIYPTFDDQLAYMASKKETGLLWSPTVAILGDYLVPLKDILISKNTNGAYNVTNNGNLPITGVTLLAEDAIESVSIDDKQLVSFGGDFGAKELVLPTLAAGESIVLDITYGTKDDSLPTVAVEDADGHKINEITSHWDSAGRRFTMTAEGKNGEYSFSIKIPELANQNVTVRDIERNIDIGSYVADSSGQISFVAHLGSLHTFTVTGPREEQEEDDDERNLNTQKIKAESTQDSITITWKTDYKVKSTVRYGTNRNLNEKKKDNDKEKKHKMTLTNLLPDTKYYFRIKSEDGDDNEDRSRIHSIKTKPAVSSKTADQDLNANQDPQEAAATSQYSGTATPKICSYTVQSGDTLWKIAQEVYGNGSAYPKIIEKNKNKYPNIDSVLSVGQELTFDCENNNEVKEVSDVKEDDKSATPSVQNQKQESSEAKWWNPFSWF